MKRHAATKLSTEAFAFVKKFGAYASPSAEEDASPGPEEARRQLFFDEATRIRAESELNFAKG